jgi:hypothetical protein
MFVEITGSIIRCSQAERFIRILKKYYVWLYLQHFKVCVFNTVPTKIRNGPNAPDNLKT